jgi:hypothetical protein
MKTIALGFVSALSLALAGCGSPAPPSSDSMKAAVIQALKKDNPAAKVEVTGMKMTEDQHAVAMSLTCDGCTKWMEASSVTPGVGPTGKGSASVREHPVEKVWEVDEIMLDMDDGSKRLVSLPFPRPKV